MGVSTVRGLAIYNAYGPGIFVTSGANGSTIAGNFIGTDASGIAPLLGNQGSGVYLDGASGVKVGGFSPDLRNVIVGNTAEGVTIVGPGSGNQVMGNYIGVDVTGDAALGNYRGVVIQNSTQNNLVGGPGERRNVISGNQDAGVAIVALARRATGFKVI